MHRRLRIHFNTEDLAQLHVAAGPDPMWETVLSMHVLQTHRASVWFDRWRQQAQRSLGSSARQLFALNPAFGSFPDFLTPGGGVTDFDAGLDAMLSTPRRRLQAELSVLAPPPGDGPWVRVVADADLEAMRLLGRLFRSYYKKTIQPVWGAVVTEISIERQRLAQAFLRGGPAAVLAGLGCAGVWRPPVWEFPYPDDRDLHLNGRGLTLIPSYFCWHRPVTLVDPALPPLLVYPLPRAHPVAHSTGDRSLSALLGTTRGAVLRALETPCNTTSLAARAGTSLPSASQHASVLRDAGLITTERHNGAARHGLTPLGTALLHAQVR